MMKKPINALSIVLVLLFLIVGNHTKATVVTVNLVDENGNPLSYYPVSSNMMSYKYRCGGSWAYGGNVQTDVNGQFATEDISCGNWDGKITLNLNGTSMEMLVTGNEVTFQTVRVNVNLKNECTGYITASPGGEVSLGVGGWPVIGNTGGTGVFSLYAFTGNMGLRMSYHWKTIQKSVTLIPGINEVDYLTTLVDIAYSGPVKYKTSGWPVVNFPIELLQGDHILKFGNFEETLSVSGCNMNGTALVANLKDSEGYGIQNGIVHLGVGGWPVIGATDVNGHFFYLYDGTLTNMRLRMTAPNYGGTETSPNQYVPTNPEFNFQTSRITIKLLDHTTYLINGGAVTIGQGGWPSIGETGDNGTGMLYHEHFLTNMSFRMYFNGTSNEISQDLSVNQEVVFQTMLAEVHLIDHEGNLLDGGMVQFGIGGWPVVGHTGDNGTGKLFHEIFPGVYTYKLSYHHGNESLTQNVGDVGLPNPVIFQTGRLTILYNGVITSNTGGWWTFPMPSVELLPGTYNFYFDGDGPTPVTIAAGDDIVLNFANQAPVAVCQDVTVNAGDNCEATVLADAVDNGSYDPDGDPVFLSLSPEGPFELGTTEVTLTATDDSGDYDECIAMITVVDNTPPIVVTQDIEIYLGADGTASITTDDIDNGSYDNCGIYSFSLDQSVFSCGDIGGHIITLTVTDNAGNIATGTSVVNVNDNIPPELIMANGTPNLWPPNHKYVSFSVNDFVVSVGDNCSSLTANDVNIISATSDEPEDANGNGDGKTIDDIVIASDCKSIDLRKERQGNGNGRVYTIYFELDDGNENVSSGSCTVHVPHNNGGVAIDDGPVYEVLGNCGNKSGSISQNLVDNNRDNMALKSYPNPFDNKTLITFNLPETSDVSLKIYNSFGQEVVTLVDGERPAGYHEVSWNGLDKQGISVNNGIYFYRLSCGEQMVVEKAIKR